jgi:hypothetical protein
MIETLIALFMFVCSGSVPTQAIEMQLDPIAGWPEHGYIVDFGWHDVDGGQILIQRHLGTGNYLIWASDQNPAEIQTGAERVFHPTCGAYLIPNPQPPAARQPEPDWRCTTLVAGRVKFLPLERCQ